MPIGYILGSRPRDWPTVAMVSVAQATPKSAPFPGQRIANRGPFLIIPLYIVDFGLHSQ